MKTDHFVTQDSKEIQPITQELIQELRLNGLGYQAMMLLQEYRNQIKKEKENILNEDIWKIKKKRDKRIYAREYYYKKQTMRR